MNILLSFGNIVETNMTKMTIFSQGRSQKMISGGSNFIFFQVINIILSYNSFGRQLMQRNLGNFMRCMVELKRYQQERTEGKMVEGIKDSFFQTPIVLMPSIL